MTEAQLRTRALRLSYFTVAYNVMEGLVSVVAGALAGSVALVGFGLDRIALLFREGRETITEGKLCAC